MGERIKGDRDKTLLRDCINILFELHKIEAQSPNDNSSWQKMSIALIDCLFDNVFGESKFDERFNAFVVRRTKDIKGKRKRPDILHEIPLTDQDREKFLKIMNSLKKAIQEDTLFHFLLDGVHTIIQKERDKWTFKPFGNEKQIPVVKLPSYDDTPDYISVADLSSMHAAMLWLESVSVLDGTYKFDYSLPVQIFRYKIFVVKHLSDFGEELLYIEPTQKPINHIQSIRNTDLSSFIKIIRSILVHFYIAFGGYNRIIVCKQCGSLCYDDREGRKEYCNGSCRAAYFRGQEDDNRRRCRHRQNKRLLTVHEYFYNLDDRTKEMMYSPRNITIENCEKCTIWNTTDDVNFKSCGGWHQRNKELFEAVKKHEPPEQWFRKHRWYNG
jgi:hypothetical protein